MKLEFSLIDFNEFKTTSVNPTFHLSALGETLLESQMILDYSSSCPYLRV